MANGIVRIHWTGGEPCLKDMVYLLGEAKKIGMIEQIMTTNGSLKLDQIKEMKKAGLTRVNISLDSLCHEKNTEITGIDAFLNTFQWIKSALVVFDGRTKMNIVPMKDNLGEIKSFVDFAKTFNGKLLLKFIELCPNNPAFYDTNIRDFSVTREMIIKELEKIGRLKRTVAIGDNPNAEYYYVGDTGIIIILITMPSQDYKCGLDKCRKMRISPFGIAGSCIEQKGVSLKGKTLEEKIKIIGQLIRAREGYSDVFPVKRRHYRKEYGFWRFGDIDKKQPED